MDLSYREPAQADRGYKCSVPALPVLFYSPKLLGAAVSLLNLGQTDGGSVGGDCINISSPKERSSFGGWTGKSLQN